MLIPQKVIEKFQVGFIPEPNSGCWLWEKSVTRSGYAQIVYQKKFYRVNRISFQIFKGEIPTGLSVCHSCDTRICVNPDHLWIGTHDDNMQDMVSKGRAKSWSTRLSKKEVLELRDLFERKILTRKQLSEKFQISYFHACNVISKNSWRQI